MDIPVYLINGFLESGKTSFIKTTFEDPEFINTSRTLLIICEEGIEEYDVEEYKKKNIDVVYATDIGALDAEFLEELNRKYRPDKVVMELNGMWKMEDVLEVDTPVGWITVQMITLINGETFESYISNMRSLIVEEFKYSDTIIVNRCEKLDRKSVRRSIKPVNRKAQILYETAGGMEAGGGEDDELPYDINQKHIDIEDDDFGLFYLDVIDNAKKYDGKEVSFRAQFYRNQNMPKDTFAPGRFAMQCCENDIGFIGIISRISSTYKDFFPTHRDRDWVYVTGIIKNQFCREYRGKGPVIYVNNLRDCEPAAEDIVYFT
ncbi:MAG: GTPase [Lachnospiraceae bacterium]|nr:GTPase [Lachnospiraceae bacterium]